MSALSDIREKEFDTWTKTEKCIVEVWEMQGLEWMAEAAADEQATLKARVKQAEENWHKNEARVAKLHSLLSRCVERVEFAAECDADGANGDEELLRYIHAALKGAE